MFNKRSAFASEGTSLARPSHSNSQDNILSQGTGEKALAVDKTLRYLLAQSPGAGNSENTIRNCSHFQHAARAAENRKPKLARPQVQKPLETEVYSKVTWHSCWKCRSAKFMRCHTYCSWRWTEKKLIWQKLVSNLAVHSGQPRCFGIRLNVNLSSDFIEGDTQNQRGKWIVPGSGAITVKSGQWSGSLFLSQTTVGRCLLAIWRTKVM